MNTNNFVNNYIKIDERLRINKKIKSLSDKYKEFTKYLDLVQKEDVYIIFLVLNKFDYVCYTMLREDIKSFNFKKWINYLLVEDFIEFASEDFSFNITSSLDCPKKPNVYVLTPKGKSFLSIDYIQEFLMEEEL